MHLNKKILVAVGMISGFAVLVSMTAIQQQPPQQRPAPTLKNIKVLSKKMTYQQVDHLMDEWASALGVKCNFCHEQDKAGDGKPEKLMARQMFEMAAKLNKKYFKAKKDSLGMVMESSINCYTCHHGVSHPEISLMANRPRPQRNGPGGQPGSGGQGTPGQNGPGTLKDPGVRSTTPPAGTPPGERK